MDLISYDKEKYDLKKLLDAKYPFLEKMRDKAPGTFKHSQNVSSLCEAVALELDIDPTLMKVLGMYHDAGKISFPECFYENQDGSRNMHDDIGDPIISFHLLTKHIADGALILIQLQDFPPELIIPITQHHGTTILKSLANKAEGVDSEMFRYKNTHTPSYLESAILMICDSVEATIRSREYSSDHIDIDYIRNIIRSTIERLEQDDQLDEVRVGDIKKIKKALQSDLQSKYHKRDSSAYKEPDSSAYKEPDVEKE
jgi:putative nucleotidyltransferase with HDIG domain